MINPPVYIKNNSLISGLGKDLEETLKNLEKSESGITTNHTEFENFGEFPLGKIPTLSYSSRFKNLLSRITANLILTEPKLIKSESTVLIVCSTKGDIEKLPENPFENLINDLETELSLSNRPILISNACISGILGINLGADLIRLGKYDHAIVIGIDILSEFVMSGFNSLFALSQKLCKPYDSDRNGINLGEAGGCVILSNKRPERGFYAVHLSGTSSNDANHISGPSRTGEGLVRTIEKTLKQAELSASDIDYINTHGTATVYNDEMESIAFNRLSLENIPMNSLKGYIGHTLGAAGVVETIISILQMEKGVLFESKGFESFGVSHPLNVLKSKQQKNIEYILKTGSGFGGGNASLVLKNVLTS